MIYSLGKIEGGKLLHYDSLQLRKIFKALEGREVETMIRAAPKNPSRAQNNYFKLCICPAMKTAWMKAGELKTIRDVEAELKDLFFWREEFKNGEWVAVHFEPKDGTRKEFSDRIGLIKEFAAKQLNYYIPDPETKGIYSLNFNR